jgi:hypothetical protein
MAKHPSKSSHNSGHSSDAGAQAAAQAMVNAANIRRAEETARREAYVAERNAQHAAQEAIKVAEQDREAARRLAEYDQQIAQQQLAKAQRAAQQTVIKPITAAEVASVDKIEQSVNKIDTTIKQQLAHVSPDSINSRLQAANKVRAKDGGNRRKHSTAINMADIKTIANAAFDPIAGSMAKKLAIAAVALSALVYIGSQSNS